MKLFCAYAFTGEDLDVLTKRMRLIVDTLNEAGHKAYCNRFDTLVDDLQSKDDIKGIFKRAFEVINENEGVVAIITTPNKSVGQIMEIGVAMSQGKPVYLFEHSSAVGSNYLNKLVDKYYTWENEDDLIANLKGIKAGSDS